MKKVKTPDEQIAEFNRMHNPLADKDMVGTDNIKPKKKLKWYQIPIMLLMLLFVLCILALPVILTICLILVAIHFA